MAWILCPHCHGRGGSFVLAKSILSRFGPVYRDVPIWKRCLFCIGAMLQECTLSASDELAAMRGSIAVPQAFRFPRNIDREMHTPSLRYPPDTMTFHKMPETVKSIQAELLKLHSVCMVYQSLHPELRFPPGFGAKNYMLRVAKWFWIHKVRFPSS